MKRGILVTMATLVAAVLLKKHLKPGDRVTLVNPNGHIGFDRYGRLLAIVLFNETSIQELMIRSGYFVLWRKYGSPPEPYLSNWLAAEEEARRDKRGCWESSPKCFQGFKLFCFGHIFYICCFHYTFSSLFQNSQKKSITGNHE